MVTETIACSPSQLIVDVASLMRVRAIDKGLGFEVKYITAIPETIQTDPTRVRQILMNLVGNAIKFTQSGCVRIIVRCDEPAGEPARISFTVADTGIGI